MNTISKLQNLAATGFKVQPRKARSKKPCVDVKGKSFPASSEEAQIMQWIEEFPQANWAVETGKASNIFVFDVDKKSGGLESLVALETKYGPLPETLTVNTGGGGKHFYFRYPREGLRSSTGKGELGGIDILSDKKFAMVPPSIHENGQKYGYCDGRGPGDIAIAPAPDWLMRLLSENKTKPNKEVTSKFCLEGQRNDFLFKRGCQHKRMGVSNDELVRYLKADNQELCKPPLDEEEVHGIAESVCSYEEASSGYLEKDGYLGYIDPRKKSFRRLANFVPRIAREEIKHDGIEGQTQYLIEGHSCNGRRLPEVKIPSSQFASMNWVSEHYGAQAIIEYGIGNKERLRHAIQVMSEDRVERVFTYSHLGWRNIEGKWHYLTHGNCISEEDVNGLNVDVGNGRLKLVSLPKIPDEEQLKKGVADVLRFKNIGNSNAAYSILATVFRAPLSVFNKIDCSTFLVGPSGTFKSELSALAQQFFGVEFDAKNLPANFTSTANALEKYAFQAKDCLLVIDDFAPTGGRNEINSYHKIAERIFRAQGNNSGRGRMSATGYVKREYAPRGIILASGEDVPRGHSCRARLFIVELTQGDINTPILSEFQSMAKAGVFSLVNAAYISWIAKNFEALKKDVSSERNAIRDLARDQLMGVHNRTPDNVANLFLGIRYFSEFLRDCNLALTEDIDGFETRALDALMDIGENQRSYLESESPAKQFVDCLKTSFDDGACHVVNLHPIDGIGDKVLEHLGNGSGRNIGYRDGRTLFLKPGSTWNLVQEASSKSGTAITVAEKTMWKRLREAGLTLGESGKNLYRKQINGRTDFYLYIKDLSQIIGEVDDGGGDE